MDQLNLTKANFTNESIFEHPSVPWTSKSVIPATLMSLFFLVGLIGNLAVIILKPNWRNLSRLTQSLVLNLALSDLLCLSTLPFWIYNVLCPWSLGVVTCKIVGFLINCSIFSSILTVTALSVQRYLQVKLQQRGLQFKKRLLVLLWITSIVLATPEFVFRQVRYTGCDRLLSPAQRVALMLTECFVGFSSFTVMACSYLFMNKKLSQDPFFNNAFISSLIISVIVFCSVLWMPYLLFNLVSVGGILNENWKIVDFYFRNYNFFVLPLFINSCLDPLVYAFALRLCRRNTNVNSGESVET